MTKDQTQKQLATVNDNDLAVLGTAARELTPTDIVGKLLQYVDGAWLIREDKDNKIRCEPSDQWITDVLSSEDGYRRWIDKKCTHRVMGRLVDGFVSPPRHLLPEPKEEDWPVGAKGPKDPWQPTRQIVMRNKKSGQLVTWVSTSYGGKLALGELLDSFVKESKAHPGEMPTVLLETYDRPSLEWGKVPSPRLKVVGWAPFGPDAAPPGDPERGRVARQALAQAQALSLPKPVVKISDDMSDAIPF